MAMQFGQHHSQYNASCYSENGRPDSIGPFAGHFGQYIPALDAAQAAHIIDMSTRKPIEALEEALRVFSGIATDPEPTNVREQILDKLVRRSGSSRPHIPPLQLSVINCEQGGFKAIVFYGAPESPRKAHFLFSSPAASFSAALHNLLSMSTKLVTEQAGKNLYPSRDLEIVDLSHDGGGFVRTTCKPTTGWSVARVDAPHYKDLDAHWWCPNETVNPEFWLHDAGRLREMEQADIHSSSDLVAW